MDTTKTITHLSLCTGYEGIGLGLRRILPTLREIAYVEIEAYPCAILASAMEQGHLHPAPIYTDLKTFPYERFLGKVSLLSGGFPCQGFSAAGLRKGVDDPRHLFPYIAKGIRACKPHAVFLENVAGIISSKTHEGESVLQYVLRELEQMGYIAEAGIFSACEIGAPHQRKRVFILGYSSSNGLQNRCPEAIGEKRQSEQGRMQESEGGSIELAHAKHIRSGGRIASGESGVDKQRCKIKKEGEAPHDIRSKTQRRGGEPRKLGDAEYLGLLGDQVHGRSGKDSQRSAEGKKASEQSPGTSRSQDLRDLCSKPSQKNKDLAHAGDQGLQVAQLGQTHARRNRERERSHVSTSKCGVGRFPARPGEPQHEWEEPRVTQIKSKLGGTNDGTTGGVDAIANRVDRLKLLGNGVVNQTAAKAFVVLTQRIHKRLSDDQ